MRKFLLVSIALLAACASNNPSDATKKNADEDYLAKPVSGYSAASWSSAVGVIPEGVVHDTARQKDIAVSIDYPTKAEKAPILIVSPAYGATNRSYEGLASYFASNGYVVIRASHADARRATNARDAQAGADAQTPTDWRERAKDISAIIESLPALETSYPELKGKLDAAKIGLAGHAYGATTATLLAGGRTFPGAVSYADPRIKAVLLMSPSGPNDARGLTNESWANLTIPAMFMSGSRDTGANDSETPEWRRRAFELSPAGDKWYVSIEGARSASFTGGNNMPLGEVFREPVTADNIPVPTDDPRVDPRAATPARIPRQGTARGDIGFYRERDIFNTAKVIARAFFDAYLNTNKEALEYLDRLSQRSDLKAETK
ncbi:MAG TPA: dienelactone hydrolase family protein [Thermoanaerobaculia bacterium]|nr:dienelactone hydrolase family protein [Thermoanaerobaculia bacterium]